MNPLTTILNQSNAYMLLLGAFAFAVAVQLFYYLFYFLRLSFYKVKTNETNNPPVSVIICARNELKNLKSFLHLVLEQDYPKYQVIVVNDCSWDESEKYLEELSEKYNHLKVVTIQEQERYQHGKKFALTLGIKSAQYEHLLLTDADCMPAGKNWISLIMQGYIKDSAQIIIGYGAYIKQPSLINKWIRFDTAFNAVHYLSFALSGNAYMGVGRNLSYLRSLFFANKGFARHQHILSGDDDLFVNETANSKNTVVQLHPESITYSQPKNGFGEWFRQKRRHFSTSKLYKTKDKWRLGFFYFSQGLCYITLAALLIIQFKIEYVVAAFGLRLAIQMAIFGSCLKKLKEGDLIWLIPIGDLFITLWYPVIAISNRFVKNKTWK